MKVDSKDLAKLEKMLKAYGSISEHKAIANNCKSCMNSCRGYCGSCKQSCTGSCKYMAR